MENNKKDNGENENAPGENKEFKILVNAREKIWKKK